MSNLFDLTGKTALVTGASGVLGAHFARVLATAGASVALAARRTDRLESLADDITAAGGSAFSVSMDVTDATSVEAAFAGIAAALGPVDILVNNSGIAKTAPALSLSDDDWTSVVDVNLNGAFRCAQSAARQMKQNGGGVIINIASILSFRVTAQVPAYAATKAGLVQMTHALALEWARDNIRVNALAPGYIATDINSDFFASPAGEAMIKRIPQRRLGQPADLDGPLLLLASDASAYMTGSVITADGGHLQSTL
ncbi:SDR family oxidoreductase [Alphaproteobacteria bacterium HT1-32]|nr:SDR family oxidoreductase [Alphaproteobacteria bacterium HT1-32]